MISYFLYDKYNLQQREVIGPILGARGTIPKFFVQFYKRFKLSSKCIDNVAIMALKDMWPSFATINMVNDEIN